MDMIELFLFFSWFRLPACPPAKVLAFTENRFSVRRKERPGGGGSLTDSGDDGDVAARPFVVGSSVVMETQGCGRAQAKSEGFNHQNGWLNVF